MIVHGLAVPGTDSNESRRCRKRIAIPPILSATDMELDALAFHFNHAGVLSAPPAYIVQAKPNEFYTVRLGSLIRGRSTSRQVEATFGRPQNIEHQSDGVLTLLRDSGLQPVRRSWRKTITRRRLKNSILNL